jgi:hypothetical protein
MPRQSDSAENKPGEKAMMRKLAATVFVLSLTALGCGSDSDTKTPDTGVTVDGGKTDVVTPSLDVQTPDAPFGPEVQASQDVSTPDLPQTIDQASVLDQAQGVDHASPTVDTAKPVDTKVIIDGAKPSVDGGVDAQHVDSGATVDSGSVDGGSAG